MKELSIEEKAKAYDEAIEKFAVILNLNTVKESGTIFADDVRKIFPELKEESEEERIRKTLMSYLRRQKEFASQKTFLGIPIEQIIAWLEKQGEQKPTDKVEPKFKIGDFIVNDYCMGRVVEITNDAYLLDTEQGIPFSSYSARLWDITKDAKDGDVLAFNDGTSGILLYKESTENFGVLSYCRIIENSFIDKEESGYSFIDKEESGYSFIDKEESGYSFIDKEESGWGLTLLSPATKEQRDLLFKKMHEAGYEWDAEKKELKKIVTPIFHIGDRVRYKGHKCDDVITEISDTDYICRFAKLPISTQDKLELVEQNPTWSEEDEIILNGCIHAFEKLSEEVNNENPQVAKDLRFCYRKNINCLKSLRPQNHLKPSEESRIV